MEAAWASFRVGNFADVGAGDASTRSIIGVDILGDKMVDPFESPDERELSGITGSCIEISAGGEFEGRTIVAIEIGSCVTSAATLDEAFCFKASVFLTRFCFLTLLAGSL
jgi:hypothetical protein